MKYLLPLIVLLPLVGFLALGLGNDPRELPSALIGDPAPAFQVPTLDNRQDMFTPDRFSEHPVSLFNVWASWCVACRVEHDLLMRISQTGAVPIYGLNYKDKRSSAKAWLARYGNPYLASAVDVAGQVGIDWGVYGVPETFVVDRQGAIRYKHIGPIRETDWKNTLQPLVTRLQQGQP